MPIFDDIILNGTNFKDNISPYSHVNRKCKTEGKLRESGISVSVATKNGVSSRIMAIKKGSCENSRKSCSKNRKTYGKGLTHRGGVGGSG